MANRVLCEGQTMGCILLIISDDNVEQIHSKVGASNTSAAKGVIDSIWNARIGSLGLKVRVDIPVAGKMIVVNDRLRVEHPPNGWPINAESGGQQYHNKADKTFAEIVAESASSIFNKTVFEGSAASQALEWDIGVENKWPLHQNLWTR